MQRVVLLILLLNSSLALGRVKSDEVRQEFIERFCGTDKSPEIQNTVTYLMQSTLWSPPYQSCEHLATAVNTYDTSWFFNNIQYGTDSTTIPFPDKGYDYRLLAYFPRISKLIYSLNERTSKSDLDQIANLTQLSSLDIKGDEYDLATINDRLKDLRFLSKLVNLKELYIRPGFWTATDIDNTRIEIKDLSPLRTLTRLETLTLINMDFSDITPLMSLGNLREVNFTGNEKLENLYGIQYLLNLKSFIFRCRAECDAFSKNNCKPCKDPKFKDLSYLKDLLWLEVLDVSNNIIEDISFLKNLKKLHSLDLQGNRISDISVLNELPNIQILSVSQNEIRNFSPISNLKNLVYLDITQNFGRKLEISSPKIEQLKASRCGLYEVPKLVDSSNLIKLDLSKNKISTFDFADFPMLTEVNLKFNKLKNIHNISLFNKDEDDRELRLENNELETFPWNDVTSFKALYLNNNNITKIDIQEPMPNLTNLEMAGNGLTELPDFENFPKLTRMDFSNNELTELPLIKHDIIYLDVSKNKLSEIKGLSFPSFNFFQVTILDASYNQLKKVDIISPAMFAVDLSYNLLEDYSVNYPVYQSLILRGNKLKRVAFNSPIRSFFLTENPDLKEFFIARPELIANFIVDNVSWSLSREKILTHSLELEGAMFADIPNAKDFLQLLPNKENIETISLANSGLTVFPEIELQGFNKLKILDLSWNNISNYDALAGFENLEDLNIMNNNLDSVSKLPILPQLKSLNLADNINISDISELSTKFPTLKKLKLDNLKKITDVSVFIGMDLSYLDMIGIPVTNLSPLRYQGLEFIRIDGNAPVIQNPDMNTCPVDGQGFGLAAICQRLFD